jgi:hypothetical protein
MEYNKEQLLFMLRLYASKDSAKQYNYLKDGIYSPIGFVLSKIGIRDEDLSENKYTIDSDSNKKWMNLLADYQITKDAVIKLEKIGPELGFDKLVEFIDFIALGGDSHDFKYKPSIDLTTSTRE